ncbi:MAG: trehalose-phosphatase [Nocardioides sp.]
MQFTSVAARERYRRFLSVASESVVGLDFDGTLAPIVDDPAHAVIHPDAPEVLLGLAEVVRAVAVITGRPVRQALSLGGLEEVGTTLGENGRELYVFGQYSNERWTSNERQVVSPRPPTGLAGLLRDLPDALAAADASAAHIEDKGLAVAIHTRRLPDPDTTLARLVPVVTALASRHGLMVEPGKRVVEVRSPGRHKGHAVRTLVADLNLRGFMYVGDDLGDVEAFDAAEDLRGEGLAALLVCAASVESSPLSDRADVIVDGPAGVLTFLNQVTAAASG